jgi:hypothetical protein
MLCYCISLLYMLFCTLYHACTVAIASMGLPVLYRELTHPPKGFILCNARYNYYQHTVESAILQQLYPCSSTERHTMWHSNVLSTVLCLVLYPCIMYTVHNEQGARLTAPTQRETIPHTASAIRVPSHLADSHPSSNTCATGTSHK